MIAYSNLCAFLYCGLLSKVLRRYTGNGVGFLEKAESPVAAGLKKGLPCSQIRVVGKGVGRIFGGEGFWKRGGRNGCLWVVGKLATVDVYLFLNGRLVWSDL